MSFNTHTIYHPLVVNSGWTSHSVSATTISAGTFYGGSLSATYVGNQNVTDQEFRYISGTTSDIQTQINNKYNRSHPFITNSGNTTLTNERIFSSSKLSSETINNEIRLSLPIRNLVLTPLSVVIPTTQSAITDFNPVGYNDGVKNQSSFWLINGNSVISGISGGTEGKILTILNNTKNKIVVFENRSTKCHPSNRIFLSLNQAIFLTKNRVLRLMYSEYENAWLEITQYDNNNQFDVFEEFLGEPQLQTTVGINTTTPSLTGEGIYMTDCGMGLYYPSTVGFVKTITSHIDSNSVFFMRNSSTTISTHGTGVSIRPQRGTIANSTNLMVAKVSLTTQTWGTNTLSFNFGFNSNINSYDIPPFQYLNFYGFMTPISTDTDKTVFYYSFHDPGVVPTNRIPLSLKLSSCTNNWAYLAIYSSGGGNYVLLSSTDNNQYTMEYAMTGIINNGFPCFYLYSNGSSATEGVYIDWVGMNNDNIY
jgi:hypothetical protein